MKAKTPEEKKQLAAYLAKHEPEMLDFLKAAREAFGISESVEYSQQVTVANNPKPAKVDPRTCWWMKPCILNETGD